MPKEVVIGPLPLFRYTGLIDFDTFYSSLVQWFQDGKYSFFEDKYGSKGSDVDIALRGEKIVTPWVKYVLEVEVKILDAKDTETAIDEKKKKVLKGRLQFLVKAKYILDPEKRWEGHWISELARDFYFAYLAKGQVKEWHGDLTKKARELYKLAKSMTQATARE